MEKVILFDVRNRLMRVDACVILTCSTCTVVTAGTVDENHGMNEQSEFWNMRKINFGLASLITRMVAEWLQKN